MLSIKIKFNVFIVDHFSSYCINFGVSRRYGFFTGYTKYHVLRATGIFTWIRTKFIWGVCLSLWMVIIGNYVHSVYSSFVGKYWVILYITNIFFLLIEIFAVSSLFKFLTANKCLESRVKTLQIFYVCIKLKW